MKTLTNEEIIQLIEQCGVAVCEKVPNCPLKDECLHYYTGENCGSALEEKES